MFTLGHPSIGYTAVDVIAKFDHSDSSSLIEVIAGGSWVAVVLLKKNNTNQLFLDPCPINSTA